MSNNALPRITARVDLETRDMLSQAAAMIGISSINSFVLNAAIEKAEKIMKRESSIKLSRRDAVALVQALDSEAKPNIRLRQAAERYDSKIQ